MSNLTRHLMVLPSMVCLPKGESLSMIPLGPLKADAMSALVEKIEVGLSIVVTTEDPVQPPFSSENRGNLLVGDACNIYSDWRCRTSQSRMLSKVSSFLASAVSRACA
ncbi:unnamed protein product [Mycena citricolor]|uniref:Uncharacterized protein n=1 Tax=Mycena citricolor TaxID=2018698 RepID=A0AAD2H626_9AGAR|nr:unnamed protein product [Mycena citricolor]